jgi:hypothetical protein
LDVSFIDVVRDKGKAPLGAPRWRPRFETRVLPRTADVDVVEAELGSTLVTMVARAHPLVSVGQVLAHLSDFYQVTPHEVWVHR